MKKFEIFRPYKSSPIKNVFNSFKERIRHLEEVIKTRTRYKGECIITYNVVIDELGCSINKSLIKSASIISIL